MKDKKFSIKSRLHSFKAAFNGLKIVVSKEHNARIHTVVATLVIIAGWWAGISKTEWIALLLCIGFLFAMELFNTAIEYLADHVTPDQHEQIREVKDLAAAGVLVAAIITAITGAIVFLPRILSAFK
ncbi:diacylglycerol kinase family protein [Flavihumibacter stibioxidans]|uniref:Diacylglycerol kinase n=1 Tax=Flavihumibacter stibioxidans TaxID=1834163 RepID=A0ABR7ME10_9BACT|nr:diacylglycerol kinase family protein [Flavihumibacter stibioxidans]MBC6493000.1 diacylglycerol kinase [Flavihumibacter stibioxidans]